MSSRRDAHRDRRDPRDLRDGRDARDAWDPRDGRDPREMRDPRDPRDARDPRDPRDTREASRYDSTQGDIVPRRAEYFVPGEGISREVIQADICRYLGPDALIRPMDYNVCHLPSPIPSAASGLIVTLGRARVHGEGIPSFYVGTVKPRSVLCRGFC